MAIDPVLLEKIRAKKKARESEGAATGGEIPQPPARDSSRSSAPPAFGSAPAEATFSDPLQRVRPKRGEDRFIERFVNYPVTETIRHIASRMESGTAGVLEPFLPTEVQRPTIGPRGKPRLGFKEKRGGVKSLKELPGAIDRSIRGAARGFIGVPVDGKLIPEPQAPAGLDPQTASYDLLRRAGLSPGAAAAADIGLSLPVGAALGMATRATAVPLLKEVGRAAEPLRQIGGIRQVGRNISPAFDVPAYRGPGKALKYIAGQEPSEREIVRLGRSTSAGEAALQAERRGDLMRVYRQGRKSLERRQSLTPEGAQDVLRTAAEEFQRQGPRALAGLSPEEIEAVHAARAIVTLERANRTSIGMKANELGAHVEKRAKIAEARLSRLSKAEEELAKAEAVQRGPDPHATLIDLREKKRQRIAGAITSEAGLPQGIARKTAQEVVRTTGPEAVIPPRLGGPGRTVQGLEAQVAREKHKTKRAMKAFEEKSGVSFGRSRKTRELDVRTAGDVLAHRNEYFVGYGGRRILTPDAREIEGFGRFGSPRSLSTSQGPHRKYPPTMGTAEVEADLLAKRGKALTEKPARFGDEALGDRPRYFEPQEEALEMGGRSADVTLEHGNFVKFMADKFGTTKELAGPGARPMSEIGSALSGFKKGEAAKMGAKYLPQRHFEFVDQVDKAVSPRNYTAIEQAARQSLRYWKPWVTLARPEFWTRNWAWSKFIQGAYGNLDPTNDAWGMGMVRQGRRGGLDPKAIATDMPKLGRVTNEQVRKLLVKHRIIGGSRAIEIGYKGGAGRAYQQFEDALRASYARHLLRKGATIEEAGKGVKDLMLNYGPEAFTPGMQRLRETFVPFASWTINIPRLTARTLGERPQAFGQLGIAGQDINRAVGLSDYEEENMGRQFEERGGFATSKPDATGRVKGVTFSPVGFYDTQQYGARGRGRGYAGPFTGAADALISQAPALGLAVTAATGYSPQAGYAARGDVRLPSWSKALEGKVPGISVEPVSGQPVGSPRLRAFLALAGPVPNIPFDIGDPRWKSWSSAWKQLTGIPFTEGNIQDTRRSKKYERDAKRREERAKKKGNRRLYRRLSEEPL